THEVTNVGTDRSQLSHVAKETKATLEATSLDVVADRGYFNSEEILACEEAGITVTLPKPMTSNSKAEGRFGKQDFRYVADEDAARGCRRDGIARAGLQSHACHEHLGRPTAHGGDEGIVVADMPPSAVAEPPKTAGIRFRNTSRSKEPPNPEK